ncbi:MAG: hypothetical protein QM698_11300 [Micropepsaceae bacterium]
MRLNDDPLVAFAREALALGRRMMAGGPSRRYRLPFAAVDLTATDDAYVQACDRALATDDGPDGGSPAAAPLRLRICVADARALGLGASPAWWEPTYGAVVFERRLEAAGLSGAYWHDGRMWTFFDRATGEGVQVLSHAGSWPPWEAASPLRLFLALAHLAAGRRLVHAATLGRAGRGVLIAGQGGAGKSGTTLAGIAAGLDTAGDDYVLVDPGPRGEGGVSVHPVYRLAKQDRTGLARLGLAHLAAATPPNWQGKHEFDVAAIGGGRVGALRLTSILMPRIAGAAATTLTPASPRDAMLALAPSSVFQIPGERASALPFFAGLARRLPSFRLDLGHDPAEIAGVIDAFIAQQP